MSALPLPRLATSSRAPLCASLLATALLAPALATAQGNAQRALDQKLSSVITEEKLDGAKIGIHVVDLKTGKTLYERDADTPLNPASNVKLLTAAAALDRLGPHHTFSTQLIAGKRTGSAITGGLTLRGNGEGFLLYKNFVYWAAQLKHKGVRTIEGGVIIDDASFGAKTTPPGFDQKKEDASYRAEVGAVSVNFNSVTVVVEPGDAAGKPARVRLEPPNAHIKVTSTATTKAGKRRGVVVKGRKNGDTTLITVKGSIGLKAGAATFRKRVNHPAKFAGAVMIQALRDVGITVKGAPRRGKAPASGAVLINHASEPLSYLILAMNKWSNNFMAEQLLRSLGNTKRGGADGFQSGLTVVRAFLKKAGVNVARQSLFNGSGLYTGNKISPRAFTTVLRYMHTTHKAGPEFAASLAIGGRDGTLVSRFRGPLLRGNLRAKTGTLNQVTAISGYMRTKSGRHVAFSVLINDPPIPRAWIYRKGQDRIVANLALGL